MQSDACSMNTSHSRKWCRLLLAQFHQTGTMKVRAFHLQHRCMPENSSVPARNFVRLSRGNRYIIGLDQDSHHVDEYGAHDVAGADVEPTPQVSEQIQMRKRPRVHVVESKYQRRHLHASHR